MEIPEIKGAIEGVPYVKPPKRKPGLKDVEQVIGTDGSAHVATDNREGHHPATEEFEPFTDIHKKKKPPTGHVDLKV